MTTSKLPLAPIGGLEQVNTEDVFPWVSQEIAGLSYKQCVLPQGRGTWYLLEGATSQVGPYSSSHVTVVNREVAVYGQRRNPIRGGERLASYWATAAGERKLEQEYDPVVTPTGFYGIRDQRLETWYLLEGQEFGPFVLSRVGIVGGRAAITARRRQKQTNGEFLFTEHVLVGGREIPLPTGCEIFLAPQESGEGDHFAIIVLCQGTWFVIFDGSRLVGPYSEKPKLSPGEPGAMIITGWQPYDRPSRLPPIGPETDLRQHAQLRPASDELTTRRVRL